MRRFTNHQSVRAARRGFTIVELLMVVGILLFLIATSAFVVRNIGNKAREKATMATIVKTNSLLTQRIQAFHKTLDSSRTQKLMQSRMNGKRAQLVSTTGNKKFNALSAPVVEILVRKDLFREQFPQFVGDSVQVNTAMDALVGAAGTAGSTGTDGGASISSEYLYYTLTQFDALGISPVGEDAFNASEVRDTDGDGLKEIVDGWGKPIRFYRWPTRLIRPYQGLVAGQPDPVLRQVAGALFSGLPPVPSPGANEPDPLNIDADDPLGRLVAENTRTNGMLNSIFNTTATYYYDNTKLMPCEYPVMSTFSMPLIVSAGEDGILGLYEPFNVTNNGVLAQPTSIPVGEGIYDNITNHNQRAGGR